jgi:hypothetical protein
MMAYMLPSSCKGGTVQNRKTEWPGLSCMFTSFLWKICVES